MNVIASLLVAWVAVAAVVATIVGAAIALRAEHRSPRPGPMQPKGLRRRPHRAARAERPRTVCAELRD
ncbi:hypothetical protein QYS60_03920 [Rhodococcus sp. GXMU-t2271]|uniref:Uncharacterized protein n=2 Tax=Rhodococcus TaxID=1827 RepID=M2YN12_9NOCA|nr:MULTISPECIES: hypothetical protein [Rhodococcus]EME63275.1 hypothetical protein G352_14908 [Rhodococcus ruber BKS 20-38]MDM7491362.1 hypothetical protein [Rhodococcus indonesiensis]